MAFARIAGTLTAADWFKLSLTDAASDTQDWEKAARMFELRIRKRFIEPADTLIAVDKKGAQEAIQAGRKDDAPTFGFSIMVLDCLLIEALQGAIDGIIDHKDQSSRLFVDFLTSAASFKPYFKTRRMAGDFYYQVRSQLVHCGATSTKFRINAFATTPLCRQRNGYTEINRTHFHVALVREFESYIKSVIGPTGANHASTQRTIQRRQNLKIVMDAICS